MRRTHWTTAAVCVAVAITAQVGFIGVRESRRSGELEQELAEYDSRSRRSLELVQGRLEQERDVSGQLRAQLLEAEVYTNLLSFELNEATVRAALLENMADEPPALEVAITPLEGLERFVAWARNPGNRPIRIVEAEGSVWIDGAASGFGRTAETISIAPTSDAEFFEFSLFGREPIQVAGGEALFRGALCLTYERDLGELTSAWSALYWFEYNRDVKRIAILARDGWAIEAPGQGCDLRSIELPW
ncbi:MAG: hypothetical protein GY725_18790 [bacterium]|nr:hypothetical protein [bacterium]